MFCVSPSLFFSPPSTLSIQSLNSEKTKFVNSFFDEAISSFSSDVKQKCSSAFSDSPEFESISPSLLHLKSSFESLSVTSVSLSSLPFHSFISSLEELALSLSNVPKVSLASGSSPKTGRAILKASLYSFDPLLSL